VDKEDLALLGPALESFLAEFADVAVMPTRKLIAAYLRGQLGPLPRKTVLPMALEAGVPPRTLQELLSIHRWDEDLLIDTLQSHVWRARGGANSVATIVETCIPKKGTHTPGVDLQRCGARERTRNSVILVHLGYSDGVFNCLLDNAVYLPRSWADAPERREAARVPPGVKYRTRPQIALNLLDRAAANGLRFGWVQFGMDYASDPQFLIKMEGRGYRYVVPRPLRRNGKHGFGTAGPWITNSDNGVAPESIARVARCGQEHAHAFELRRKEIGLDHFEVRTYRSLLRHLALSAASILFLEEWVGRATTRKDQTPMESRVL
jgi:SRSO17 transposase